MAAFFSKRTRSLRNRLSQEWQASTTHRRARARGVPAFRGGLLPAVLDVGHIARRGQRRPGDGVVIALVRAEVLGVAGRGPGPGEHGRPEDLGEPEVVIHVRPADDEGERDASPVH